ncbi:keratin-associated protein 5-1-like [Cydia pomonella]|uniref:keratin-associated protein 5-1-like n=1 Tax=Cydia pomonella TaxID=82600 RepID=UPI002ADE2B2C|nr:keratin-associated protein 5-1-like [Cydia pomonella]
MWPLILSLMVLFDGIYGACDVHCSDLCTENMVQLDTSSKSCTAQCSGPTACGATCASKDQEDQCVIECIGPECRASCKGVGCKAVCSGSRCIAECKGEGCSSVCYTSSCSATCEGLNCLSKADVKLMDRASNVKADIKCNGKNCTSECNGLDCVVMCTAGIGETCNAQCTSEDKEKSNCVQLVVLGTTGQININV